MKYMKTKLIIFNLVITTLWASPESDRSKFLSGLHGLMDIVEEGGSGSLKELAQEIGVDESIQSFAFSDLTMIQEYEVSLNRDFSTGGIAEHFANGLLPKLDVVEGYLSQVSASADLTMETEMTGADEPIYADGTDVLVLRTMVNLLSSLLSLQSGYDWGFELRYLEGREMGESDPTVEAILARYPDLLGVRDANQLAKSKTYLSSAISLYKQAREGLRASGRYAEYGQAEPKYLFYLEEGELLDEAEFLEDLEELESALSGVYELLEDGEVAGEGVRVDLSALYSGKVDFRDLLPDAIGDKLKGDMLTDPTAGGLFPDEDKSGELNADIREFLYDSEVVYGQPTWESEHGENWNIWDWYAQYSFDADTYVEVNRDVLPDYLLNLGPWDQWQIWDHFRYTGYWQGLRDFAYPYEESDSLEIEADTDLADFHFKLSEELGYGPTVLVYSPSGKPVVVSDSGIIKWYAGLDGVTLWSVVRFEDSFKQMTMHFENGKSWAVEGLHDWQSMSGAYEPYAFIIDEDGHIQISDNQGIMYYNVINVDDVAIETLVGDAQDVVPSTEGPIDQWFFTSSSATLDFYYSKAGYPTPRSWQWFDHYPWVYSQEEQGWLYFYPSGGKLLYYSNKNQVWREFSQ